MNIRGGKVDKAHVALGGVAPIPWHATASEQVLAGKPLTDESIDQAAVAATTGARPLAQNEYKIDLVQGVVRQALQAQRSQWELTTINKTLDQR